jgi:tetratricopeptide (TPR) repeat protein
MKKIFIAFSLILFASISYAQSKTEDSLKNVLSVNTEPLDRFDIINKMLLNTAWFQAGVIDSSYCVELLQIANELGDDSLLAISYNWIGSYFTINKGDNTTALEYYFKALPLAENVKDNRRLSSLYFDIALVYFILENNEEAVKNVRKGGANLPDSSSPYYNYMLVQYQRGMANYYLLANKPDSALFYGLALSESSRKLKSTFFRYASMYLNGSAYAESGEKELAEIYFKKAIAMSDSVKITSAKYRFGNYYIPFLFDNKRFREARAQSMQLFDLGNQTNNIDIKLAAAGFMRRVYDSLHRPDSSYYFARIQIALGDSVYSQNNVDRIQALAFNEKLRVIDEDAKKTEENEQRKQNIQYALITLAIVLLILLFLLLSRSFITNEKAIEFFGVIALLIVFEFLNLLLHPFLARITHHTPVLMLLALVCMGGLLVPIHHRLEKWAIKKLVEKNKAIRLAAAKKTIEKLEKRSGEL